MPFSFRLLIFSDVLLWVPFLSAALTYDPLWFSGGRLLSWGWNEHGMCGDGSHADVFQPKLVPALRPLLIGCGAGHSLAVCASVAASEDRKCTSTVI